MQSVSAIAVHSSCCHWPPTAPCCSSRPPHISMAMGCFKPLTRIQTLANVDSICDKHGIDRCTAAGHSFGSIPGEWHKAVILEPVCFLMVLPTTIYNFVYRVPKKSIQYAFRFLTTRRSTNRYSAETFLVVRGQSLHGGSPMELEGKREVCLTDCFDCRMSETTPAKEYHVMAISTRRLTNA